MKDNKAPTIPKCAKCPAAQTALIQIQTKVTQAEARIVVLLEQLSARQSAPTPPADLSPFLTKALDCGKPDYAGLGPRFPTDRRPPSRAGSRHSSSFCVLCS
jgi:hypothetical protein